MMARRSRRSVISVRPSSPLLCLARSSSASTRWSISLISSSQPFTCAVSFGRSLRLEGSRDARKPAVDILASCASSSGSGRNSPETMRKNRKNCQLSVVISSRPTPTRMTVPFSSEPCPLSTKAAPRRPRRVGIVAMVSRFDDRRRPACAGDAIGVGGLAQAMSEAWESINVVGLMISTNSFAVSRAIAVSFSSSHFHTRVPQARVIGHSSSVPGGAMFTLSRTTNACTPSSLSVSFCLSCPSGRRETRLESFPKLPTRRRRSGSSPCIVSPTSMPNCEFSRSKIHRTSWTVEGGGVGEGRGAVSSSSRVCSGMVVVCSGVSCCGDTPVELNVVDSTEGGESMVKSSRGAMASSQSSSVDTEKLRRTVDSTSVANVTMSSHASMRHRVSGSHWRNI
mmetsp:Transcript_29442/g.63561  ORF Transcript_29442/g.63561 Transcript_29442/m.63561 type:complete len:396 (-) Transcript_29442:736-1923(-)